jgi:hypothetical protein
MRYIWPVGGGVGTYYGHFSDAAASISPMQAIYTSPGGAASPYVPVFVPARRLQAVYRMLADESSDEPGASPTPSSESPQVHPLADDEASAGPADERFRDPDFVKTHLASRSETVRGVAKYLAQRPGQWITSEPIADALNLEHGWNSLAGALGAAGHYFKNRSIGMPWNWTYETPDRRVQLMMDAETADVILSVL